MNYVEKILEQLSTKKGFNFSRKIRTPIENNQLHCFSLSSNVNTIELYVDKNLDFCYFISVIDGKFNLDMLIDKNAIVVFSNEQSKLIPEQKEINLKTNQIISIFSSIKGKPKYSIDQFCHHFFDERFKVKNKYPIPLKHCHILKKDIFNNVALLQDKNRNDFNEREQKCNYPGCNTFTKLVESHLVSANNIRLLGGGKKSKIYYGTRFFQELKEKPLSSLQDLSEEPRNFKNRNFKIACFCQDCEKKFKKTDENNFNHITDVTDEIIKKCFGIYLQELKCNLEFISKLKNDSRFKKIDMSIFKEKDTITDLSILEHKNNLLKDDKLNKFQHHLIFKLKGKAFIESVSLSFHGNYYYLIYITNKDDKMHVNIITDDLRFPLEINLLDLGNIISSSIGLGAYSLYSEDFYDDFSGKASDMILEYFNNKRGTFVHPLLTILIKHVEEVGGVLSKYIGYPKFDNKEVFRIIPKNKNKLISGNYNGYFIQDGEKKSIHIQNWLKNKHEIGDTFYSDTITWIYTNTSNLENYYEKVEDVYILILQENKNEIK